MSSRKQPLAPLADRGPLRVMFIITSMPVGGAETLLVNLIRRLDRNRFLPQLCCMKQFGPLGDELRLEIPAEENLLTSKYDLRVFKRLTTLLRERRIDAVVTVGAGDKMFWGRLCAWRAGVPVVLSALHSTGWPDVIGRLNRLLTPLTDGFIGVAEAHGKYLAEVERFPRSKVRVIPNGIDVARFQRLPAGLAVREHLGLTDITPVAGIVAALRPEKNHDLFLRAAASVTKRLPAARFLIIGDGPERLRLEQLAALLGVDHAVRFLGTRSDIPALLSSLDVFMLTSRMEANPVSILEALACETPVVATNVGSIATSVLEGQTGFLVPPGDEAALAERTFQLLANPGLSRRLGAAGRDRVVAHASLERMVDGYSALVEEIYQSKCARPAGSAPRAATSTKVAGAK